MKDRGTVIYVGNQVNLANALVDENYTVNMVDFVNQRHIAEFTKSLDGETIEVATDRLAGNCPAIIIDTQFFEGIDSISEKIIEMIKTKIRATFSLDIEHEDYSNDEVALQIQSVLDRLPEGIETVVKHINQKEVNIETIEKAIDNFLTQAGNKYIQMIMKNMNFRTIIGDRNYDVLKMSVDEIKKAADERIKDSRIQSSDKRDMPTYDLEGNSVENDDERWRPMLILTSNDNFQDKTEAPEVSNEYFKMDVIKEILSQSGLELTVSGIVNTRTIQNGRGVAEPEKLVKAVKWAEFLSNSEEKVNRNVKDFMKDAFEMFDILDVNGGIVNHSLRTAELMKCLLESMYKKSQNVYSGDRVPKHEWKAYITGALFHDNGKLLNISRPDLANFLPTLQTNSSRLPKEGFDAVRSHAEIGGDNIQSIIDNPEIKGRKNYLEVVATMAYYHQEFFLGDQGYSINKKHDEKIGDIPLEAQYMAIVDVFDAIIGRRNYNKETDKKGAEKLPTMEQAIDIMAKQAGIVIIEDNKSGKEVKEGQWCMSDKIRFDRSPGYFLDNDAAHFNQNLLMCFFEFLQSETVKFRDGKKSILKFKEDAQGRLVVESIGGIGFEQYLHRESLDIAKSHLANPSKLGKRIQEHWKKGREKIADSIER